MLVNELARLSVLITTTERPMAMLQHARFFRNFPPGGPAVSHQTTVDMVLSEATGWVNQNDAEIDVVTLSMGTTAHAAYVVVWYHPKSTGKSAAADDNDAPNA